MLFYAWEIGLKTGLYYLRSRAAVDAVQVTLKPQSESRDPVPDDEERRGSSTPTSSDRGDRGSDRGSTGGMTDSRTEADIVGEICTMEEGCISCGA